MGMRNVPVQAARVSALGPSCSLPNSNAIGRSLEMSKEERAAGSRWPAYTANPCPASSRAACAPEACFSTSSHLCASCVTRRCAASSRASWETTCTRQRPRPSAVRSTAATLCASSRRSSTTVTLRSRAQTTASIRASRSGVSSDSQKASSPLRSSPAGSSSPRSTSSVSPRGPASSAGSRWGFPIHARTGRRGVTCASWIGRVPGARMGLSAPPGYADRARAAAAGLRCPGRAPWRRAARPGLRRWPRRRGARGSCAA